MGAPLERQRTLDGWTRIVRGKCQPVPKIGWTIEDGALLSDADETSMLCKYVAGLMVHMKYSRLSKDALAIQLQRDDGWDDFTPMQLKKVVAALNLQVRRKR